MATRNLTAVEGLRFLLFLGIFVFHCKSDWLPLGWGGVESFLVIGAFFLTRKHLKTDSVQINVGKSFAHRIKRLYPAYISLVIFVSVGYVYAKHELSAEPLWYLFAIQNFRCLFEGAGYSLDGFLGHFWYISLDVWLFLIWLLVLRHVKKQYLRAAFVTSLIIGLVWRIVFVLSMPNIPGISYVIPFGQLDSWSIGGLVALNLKEKGNNTKLIWSEISIGLTGILLLIAYNGYVHDASIVDGYMSFKSARGYMTNPLTGNIHLFIAILSAGLLRYSLNEKWQHPVLSSAPFVALGGMTYELYCFHYPVKVVVNHFIHNQWLFLLLALLTTYIISLIWCRWVSPIVNKVIH